MISLGPPVVRAVGSTKAFPSLLKSALSGNRSESTQGEGDLARAEILTLRLSLELPRRCALRRTLVPSHHLPHLRILFPGSPDMQASPSLIGRAEA